MGNHAIITPSTEPGTPCLYLHWNGGPESVLAFLDAARARKYRDPIQDPYGMARLCGLIHEFFGIRNHPEDAPFVGDFNGLSLGIMSYHTGVGKCMDNGTYVLGPDWTIGRRLDYGDNALHSSDPVMRVSQLDKEGLEKYHAIMERLATTPYLVQPTTDPV